VLFLLTLLVPIASTADPAPLPDLWVSELRATAVGGSPFDGTDVRVTIACTRPDLFTTSAGAQLWVNDEPTPRHVVAFDATSLQFTRRLTLQTDDEVRVILDPSDSVEEVNELNNWLVKAIGDVWGSNPCSPYPFSFTIPSPDDPDDPSQDLTLECVRCERSQRTGYFPWAYLILPPYEWDESDPNGTMRTELSSGTFSGSESSNTTGFTAGIAVEASGGIPFVAEVKIGLEIEREWSQEHGLGTETNQSETFWTDTSAGAGPGLGEPAVVVSQTTHEVAEYRVITSGNWYGESFVIATPLREPFRDNPELLQVGHSTYDDIRDPEAVELVEYHWVGSADTYPDSHHGWRHLASVTNPRWHLLAKRSQYNIAGADWDITRRRYSQSTTTVTTRVNAYASGSFLAAGAQASFGTLDGRSHRTWHGTETTYHWTVGPTYGPRFGYRLMGLAENLYFEHDPLGNGKVRQDRVLLLDYYMVERARGWPWSTWESFLEHVLRGENWVINWPEAPTHGFPDALAAVLVQPAAGTPSLYYDHLRTLTGALDDWAQEFPADRVDEMRERIADLDHDVQTVQLYDPNNSAYYDLFALQLAEIMAEGAPVRSLASATTRWSARCPMTLRQCSCVGQRMRGLPGSTSPWTR
jgi:hypothetical protein